MAGKIALNSQRVKQIESKGHSKCSYAVHEESLMNSRGEEHNNNTRRVSRGGQI